MGAHRPLRVKFILPALTEATSPYWRPIKYSLFPPLGLATLAAYLDPDDEAVIVDEHVQPLSLDDAPGPRRDPGLHHQRVPRLSRWRIATAPGAAFVALGGLHVTSLPDGGGAARRRHLSRSGEQTFPQFLEGLPRAAVPARSYRRRRGERSSACRRSAAI